MQGKYLAHRDLRAERRETCIVYAGDYTYPACNVRHATCGRTTVLHQTRIAQASNGNGERWTVCLVGDDECGTPAFGPRFSFCATSKCADI